MTTQQYIENIQNRYQLGNATEHTFRGDLQQLIESIVPFVRATNEPKRQACGAPDYILTKKDIPIGFIEAKNIGDNDLSGLKKTGNKEQFDRYKKSLNNIIFTDYIDFHLYRNEQFITKIAIAQLTDKGIEPITENFASFENLLKDFCANIGQTINSSQKLAEMMAAKARLLAEVIEKALTSDETHNEDSTLKDQMTAFKEVLIHDITPKTFADVYSQTICYGMFAARYHDPTLPTFSRQEAYELIPKSNPFLKKLFGYIAGLDLDDRIKWIVDDLVNIFLACDVAEILKNYGQSTKMEDPIIHFYEDFLSEYDTKLRKARGVWYTPQYVVNFIVRAVDDILKTEFDLQNGLAEKVEILDPATGTGTFLAEIIKHIYKQFEGQTGSWSNYLETNLLPRLSGFELLMASYAMAHLKLDMLLTETGFKPTLNQRFKVFLTNSLEEQHPDTKTLFASWLSDEANGANHIKRQSPLMVILGNPPYAVSSSNKGEWIQKLIGDYKKGLNERKINLDDDYIKFIRLGQHFIDKNGSGVLAYISNNSFLDGVTHRQMRKSLLESFDKIYILNLHGSARKKETAPDGSPDQNVFDIMQGVSINIFIKTGQKKENETGQVHYFDLQGKREFKFKTLFENSLKSITWSKLDSSAPNYFFVTKNFNEIKNYETGFKIDELFIENVSGVESVRDAITIHFGMESLKKVIDDFSNLSEIEIAQKYKTTDARDWKINRAKEDIKTNHDKPTAWQNISYRPYDIRKTFYTGKQNGFVCNGRFNVMRNLLKDNIAIVLPRMCKGHGGFQHGLVSKYIIDRAFGDAFSGAGTNVFPLYLYPETANNEEQSEYRKSLEARLEEAKMHVEGFEKTFSKIKKMYAAIPSPDAEMKKYYKEQEKLHKKLNSDVEKFKNQLASLTSNTIFEEPLRTPNLNITIVNQIAEKLGLEFVPEKIDNSPFTINNYFSPIDILDYIYAVLHSPNYREKYKEFLKIDFPRVPFPQTLSKFRTLAKFGSELRQIHLLESPIVEKFITQYAVNGDNLVVKPYFDGKDLLGFQNLIGLGRVYINETQYFENVPEVAWNFYVGGYQPAQKWLKDRKDRTLDFDDIQHYQKIIVALYETDRLMTEIDTLEIE